MSGATGNLQGIKVELGIGEVVIFLESDIRLTSFDGRNVCYAVIPLTRAERRSVFEVLTNMVEMGEVDGQPVLFIPTPENINALPEGIRGYIHELEARCDPAGEFRAWKVGEDAVLALAIENKALKKRIVELEAGVGMSNLDKLIKEFEDGPGSFHLGLELQSEIKKMRDRIVELEKNTVDDSGGYSSWGCD